MNIIVYGSTKQIAYDRLDKLLGNMRYKEIERVIKNQYEYTVVLKNGDIYKALMASDNARGYKWQYAVIDKTIDKKIIDNVILPSFVKTDIFEFEESYIFY